MPSAIANGIRLHYELDGEGPTVLLLHPVGLDLHCWTAQADALRSKYRVLRVDLRGHGESEVPPSPCSLEDLAADVHSLLDALGSDPAHVVGLSLGGMVAQVLALECPEDVLSLVLADTVSSHSAEGRQSMLARAEAAEVGGMDGVAQSTLERWFTPSFMESDVVGRVRERLLADSVQGWAATWRAIAGLDTEDRLGSIFVPTLVVVGELDVSAPPARARSIADLIPGARLCVIPGAPHMAPLEMPDLFNQVVLEFLEEVSP